MTNLAFFQFFTLCITCASILHRLLSKSSALFPQSTIAMDIASPHPAMNMSPEQIKQEIAAL
jgi:hypothetical protein